MSASVPPQRVACDVLAAGMVIPTEGPARKRVLVVEDDAEMRTLLHEYLESRGFDVATAPDAAGAVDWLRESPVDVVVSDLSLPGDSGIILLRRLRQLAISAPRFIFITAFGDWRSCAEALSLGASRSMTKPFRMDDLVAEIRSTLAG
ncbi:MAG: response regulator transcription factor [Acidobacteriota bacterium]